MRRLPIIFISTAAVAVFAGGAARAATVVDDQRPVRPPVTVRATEAEVENEDVVVVGHDTEIERERIEVERPAGIEINDDRGAGPTMAPTTTPTSSVPTTATVATVPATAPPSTVDDRRARGAAERGDDRGRGAAAPGDDRGRGARGPSTGATPTASTTPTVAEPRGEHGTDDGASHDVTADDRGHDDVTTAPSTSVAPVATSTPTTVADAGHAADDGANHDLTIDDAGRRGGRH